MNEKNMSQAKAEPFIVKAIEKYKKDKANEGKPQTDEDRFAFPEHQLVAVAPVAGVDTAKLGDKPAWCDVVPAFEPDERWTTGRIGRTFVNPDSRVTEAAFHVCQRPTDPTWKQFAQLILQSWMNWTGLNQADAEKSLRARVQSAQFEAQRVELCQGLVFSEELAGQTKTYAMARRRMFGCGRDESWLLWETTRGMNAGGVGYYLDADGQVDELMRVYWLFGAIAATSDDKPLPAKDAFGNTALLDYALAQNDAAKLDAATVQKALTGAPYNDYARVVMMETVSVLKSRVRALEQATAKLTKGDEDYTAILVGAPKGAWAQWDKAMAGWGPEIERSNAYERLFSQPSRKALKGCAPAMTKDLQKLLKSYKINVYRDLVDKIAADPVANVLLRRAGWCYAIDGVGGTSGVVRDLVQKGRDLRGPRGLARYAIIDALNEAKKDRPRLVLQVENFYGGLEGETNSDSMRFDYSGGMGYDIDRTSPHGVVASVAKVKGGVEVKFKHSSYQYAEEICHDDKSHMLKIDRDGTIRYYQICKYTGRTLTEDTTPEPITVSELIAGGVKPGVYAQGDNQTGVIHFTRASSKDKTIKSFYGFDL